MFFTLILCSCARAEEKFEVKEKAMPEPEKAAAGSAPVEPEEDEEALAAARCALPVFLRVCRACALAQSSSVHRALSLNGSLAADWCCICASTGLPLPMLARPPRPPRLPPWKQRRSACVSKRRPALAPRPKLALSC
jgi:hypothetical protein